MPHITVIIVTYNAGRHLYTCLEALHEQTFRDFDVIITDNASTDHSLTEEMIVDINDAGTDVRVIRNAGNLGFAAANNRAVAETHSSWLVFLNPDAFPEKDWLERLVEGTKEYPEVAMFGSTQLSAENYNIVDGAGDMLFALGIPWRALHGQPVHLLPGFDAEIFAPCAAASMIRADAFLEAGGFDGNFFCYCEDVDLAFRLRLRTYRCVQLSRAVVTHVGSATTGRNSYFSVFHGARNRIWVFVKNMPPLLFWPLLPLHLLAQVTLVIHAATHGSGYAAFRGLISGLIGVPRQWKKRRYTQSRRTASTRDVIRFLEWSPLLLLRRSGRYKQVK